MTWHYLWTNQNAMSESDKYDNAREIWDRLTLVYGCTEQASAAIIANFQSEGLLNPCQWQLGSTIGDWDNSSVGLGLGQWTPASKLADYMGGRTELAISDGNKQVDFTVTNSGQWIQRVNSYGYSSYYQRGGIPYITSISQFMQSTLSTDDLATCWCACWEGPSKTAFNDSYQIRRDRAIYWLSEFGSSTGNRIYVYSTGNGTAYVDNPNPEDEQDFTLYAIPADGETLEDITAVDSHGYSIAMDVVEQHTYTYYQSSYGNYIKIAVAFSGITPPPPFLHKKKTMPLWMMVNRNRNVFVIK